MKGIRLTAAGRGVFPFASHLPLDEADFMVFEICNRGLQAVLINADEYNMRIGEIEAFYRRNRTCIDARMVKRSAAE